MTAERVLTALQRIKVTHPEVMNEEFEMAHDGNSFRAGDCEVAMIIRHMPSIGELFAEKKLMALKNLKPLMKALMKEKVMGDDDAPKSGLAARLTGKKQSVDLGDKGSFTVKKGALHRMLGVPQGDKIPASDLKSKPSDSPLLKRRKASAMGFRAMNHGDK